MVRYHILSVTVKECAERDMVIAEFKRESIMNCDYNYSAARPLSPYAMTSVSYEYCSLIGSTRLRVEHTKCDSSLFIVRATLQAIAADIKIRAGTYVPD